MDSQLAIAQISNSLDDQNVSQSLDESGPKVFVGPKDKTLPSTLPGNFQLFPITAVSSRHAFSINREMSALGATSKPGLKTCKSDGLRQPITVKTSMPVLNNQPIRIKIVVPQRCKKPITNNTTSLTKELLPSQFTRSTHVPTVSITGKNTCKIPPTPSPLAIMYEQETEEVIDQKIETPKAGPLCEMGMDGKKESDKEDDNANEQNDRANINPTTASEPPLVASSETAQARKPTEKRAVSRNENAFPPNLQEVDLKVTESVGLEVGVHGEQTEPLDLSLPKKRESNERRYGHLWEDSCCESSLIMEVDEFEGDGDRDVVEEDDNGGTEEGGRVFHASGVDTFGESILSPSFFSTSVLTALSSIDSDNEKLLFIDDQGIPYNLSPEGHKVPQIDTSKIEDPPSGHSLMRTNSVEAKRKGVSQSVSLMGSNLSQSLDDPAETLSAPRDNLASLASVADSQSQRVDPSKAAELSTSAPLTENHEPPKDPESCIPAANETGGVSASDQPVPILTNPSTSTSILLLSSPLSSSPLQCSPSPMGLSFPISVPQNQAASSAPMFLLLSSVPSSAGQPVAASTPIAVLDPSTGQLSQITGSSSQLSLPVSSGQVGKFGSSLLSYPVIQLSPNNTSVVLPGGGSHNLNTTSSSAPALQTPNLIPSVGAINNVAPIILTQTVFSDSNVETKVISTEENTKPSTFTPTRSASPLKTFDGTHDTLAHSSPQAADQSPRSEPEIDPPNPQLETVPLEDHLYFSSTRAPPPSPPIGPILPTSQLDSMDPLDPLSPASSPNSMGPRKVLYCQLCPRVFFYLSDLERHAITHSQKKPHICQQCGKAFKRSSHLQRHKHIHTGQRNYVCPICAKRFREAGELQRHQRVHTGEKPYQCQLCHTRFAERNTLRRHTKRKHPYHQVAMEMLNERRGGAGGACAGGGGGGVQEEEESAEWYSSTVSTLENSESDMES